MKQGASNSAASLESLIGRPGNRKPRRPLVGCYPPLLGHSTHQYNERAAISPPWPPRPTTQRCSLYTLRCSSRIAVSLWLCVCAHAYMDGLRYGWNLVFGVLWERERNVRSAVRRASYETVGKHATRVGER